MSRLQKYTTTASTTTPIFTIENKDFYIKHCFLNPNKYYSTRSLSKVKVIDEPFEKTRNKPFDIKAFSSDKWKIKVKDLNSSSGANHNGDSFFLTLNKEADISHQHSDPSRKVSSPTKLHKPNTIHYRTRKITEERIKIKLNIKDYNKKILENNNKKHFVFYKVSPKKTLLLPSVIFSQSQRIFTKTNSRLISLNKSKEIKELLNKIDKCAPVLLTN
jgi:hypothetical protein